MQNRKIGFIGLGNMGGRMTRCLVDAGISVTGFDTQPGAAERAGAKPAASIREVSEENTVILLSLPDSHIVEQVVSGKDGIGAFCRPGHTIVDLSTAAASSTQKLSALLQPRGIHYIDAGISGGAAAAEKGALTLMVGGDREAIKAIDWVFAPIASKVVVMGDSGTGHITKLLNNFLNAVSLAATAEVMVAGKKAGLDLQQLLEVLNSSSGVNFATLNRFPRIVQGDYLEGGLTGKLMTKDLVLYADLLHQLGMASLNTAGPLASFGLGTALGYGDVISNRVVDAIGDISGGVRLHTPDNKEDCSMKIIYGRQPGMPSEKRGATFTGEVWADAVMPTQDNVTINNVFFTPGARTWWHTHEQGQILQVVAGEGWICLAGESAKIIRTGDTVWIPAGERHWHGASVHSYLLHTAISLGKTDWQDEVADEDYANTEGEHHV